MPKRNYLRPENFFLPPEGKQVPPVFPSAASPAPCGRHTATFALRKSKQTAIWLNLVKYEKSIWLQSVDYFFTFAAKFIDYDLKIMQAVSISKRFPNKIHDFHAWGAAALI